MSDTQPHSLPQLCLHKASGLAVVRLNGKDHYCGPWSSPATQAKYHRLIAEWISSGVPGDDKQVESDMGIISNLVAAYFKHVRQYYRKHGVITSEVYSQKCAISFVARLYADLQIDEFGPRRLKACRQPGHLSGTHPCGVRRGPFGPFFCGFVIHNRHSRWSLVLFDTLNIKNAGGRAACFVSAAPDDRDGPDFANLPVTETTCLWHSPPFTFKTASLPLARPLASCSFFRWNKEKSGESDISAVIRTL